MSENAQNFEEKVKQANEILAKLNDPSVSLEQSVELHELGKKLIEEAREILERAELIIKQADE